MDPMPPIVNRPLPQRRNTNPATSPTPTPRTTLTRFPPTGFRLFGFGGKKKAEDPAPAPPAPKKAASSYAPGSGLIEEEVIEEEEFDAPHYHHGKAEEHDLEDYEEETLPIQMRSGDLGELLQEAHLDHRIQLNFDGKKTAKKTTRTKKTTPKRPPLRASLLPLKARASSAAIAQAADAVDAARKAHPARTRAVAARRAAPRRPPTCPSFPIS